MIRLAIIATHPIQYYVPWYIHLSRIDHLEVRVFYLWDFGVIETSDPGFGTSFKWDIPLLDGYEHEFVPNVSKNPGTFHFGGLKNPGLRQRIAAWKPDAVFLMSYRYWSILHFILKPPGKFPLIFRGDSHRMHRARTSLKEKLREVVISKIFSRFDAVLPVGKANRDYYRIHGVPEEKMFDSPHCVDVDTFVSLRSQAFRDAALWKGELGIPRNHRVILFAGKLTPVKRPQDLLHAFRMAAPPRSVLLIVGSGEMEGELRELAEGSESIYFLPFQNQSRMPRVIALGDIIALPSESETWGLILNEAMCYSKPLLVSDRVGAGPDLVVEKENGIIHPMGDIKAIADAMNYMLEDDSRLESWGNRSFEIVKGHTYKEASRGLLDALDHSLSKAKLR